MYLVINVFCTYVTIFVYIYLTKWFINTVEDI